MLNLTESGMQYALVGGKNSGALCKFLECASYTYCIWRCVFLHAPNIQCHRAENEIWLACLRSPHFMWSRISGAFLNCTCLQSGSISLLQTSPQKPAPSCCRKTCLLTHLQMDNCLEQVILWLDVTVTEWFNMTKCRRGYVKTNFWASEVQRATVQTGMAATHCNRGTGERLDTKRYGDG